MYIVPLAGTGPNICLAGLDRANAGSAVDPRGLRDHSSKARRGASLVHFCRTAPCQHDGISCGLQGEADHPADAAPSSGHKRDLAVRRYGYPVLISRNGWGLKAADDCATPCLHRWMSGWKSSLRNADGGEAGIRTLGAAIQPHNGLANRRLQPLGHLSLERSLECERRAS